MDTIREGPLMGFPIIACRMALNDGAHHAVDSSEKAFRTAVAMAFRYPRSPCFSPNTFLAKYPRFCP